MSETDLQEVTKVVNKTVGQNGQVYVGKELEGQDVKVAVWVQEK